MIRKHKLPKKIKRPTFEEATAANAIDQAASRFIIHPNEVTITQPPKK